MQTTARSATAIVFYHGGCVDGTAASIIVQQFVLPSTSIWFVPLAPADLTKPGALENLLAQCEFKITVFADTLPAPDMLEALVPRVPRLICIDHHISNRPAHERVKALPNVTSVFDITKCAALLAWEMAAAKKGGMPWILPYINDYDLNLGMFPETDALHCVLTGSFAQMVASIKAIIRNNDPREKDGMLERGKKMLAEQTCLVEAAAAEGRMMTLVLPDGSARYAVAVAKTDSSDMITPVGHALCARFPAAAFGVVLIGIKCGLRGRNEDEIDLSAIAAKFGGGGHTHASGFKFRDEEERGRLLVARE